MDNVFHFSAPGRTEIGGNHTDHQHGCVLAAAVNMETTAEVTLNGTNIIRVDSEGYPVVEIDLTDLALREEEKNSTAALIRGVAAAFAQRGYKLAGCSSADRVKVLMNLGAIGAEQTLFDHLVTGTDIKNPKPDPEIYQTGAASLGLAPAECIVVEDAPSGIRAAHAAGIQAIGLATSFPAEYLREQAQPDYLLPDLKSVLTML